MRLAVLLGAVAVLTPIVSAADVGRPSPRDDTYCSGARYAVGNPFLDTSKVDPHSDSLINLQYDPIVKIDRVQRGGGEARRTIAYVYYNRQGLADLAPAREATTTPADKDEFRRILTRIGGIDPSAWKRLPPTELGDGFIRFLARTRLNEVLDSGNSVEPCVNPLPSG